MISNPAMPSLVAMTSRLAAGWNAHSVSVRDQDRTVLSRLLADGYAVVPDLLTPAQLDTLKQVIPQASSVAVHIRAAVCRMLYHVLNPLVSKSAHHVLYIHLVDRQLNVSALLLVSLHLVISLASPSISVPA